MAAEILLSLVVLLLAARIGGLIAKRVGMIAVIGEIIAGIIVGPGVLHLFSPSPVSELIADLGLILLMFLIGLRLDLKTFQRFLKSGTISAIFGAFIPFGVGILFAANYLHWTPLQSLFLGGILMATSVSIAVRMMDELHTSRSKVSLVILDAAVIENMFAVVLLTFFVGFATGTIVSLNTILYKGLLMIIFFAAMLLLGPRIGSWIIEAGNAMNLRLKEGLFSLILILIFGITYIADAIGLSIVIGAFFSGVILHEKHLKHVEHEVYGMAYSWFIPFFFAFVGTQVNPGVLVHNLPWIFAIFVIAVISKFVGVWLGENVSGERGKSTILTSIGMLPRGELSIILVGLGLETGIFGDTLFSGLMVVLVLTMLVTPPLYRLANRVL